MRIECQQRQRCGQFRLAARRLLPRTAAPLVINMPGSGGTLPETICNATRSSFVLRDYVV